MDLKEKIDYLLSIKTLRHSAITFGATFINGLLGIIFFIILARNLSPGEFGLISVSIATFILIADIADLGVNTGIINFVSKYLHQDLTQAYRFMKLALKIKILVWIIAVFLGWLAAPLIAKYLLLKEELAFSLQLTLAGLGSALFFSFATNCLLAFQKYLSWGTVTIVANTLRLALILILLMVVRLNTTTALISYLVAPMVGFFIGLMFLPLKFLQVTKEDRVIKEFFKFNKWIIIVTVLGAVGLRMDTFLVTRFLSISEVGIYSVASQLSMVIPQITFALATVVAPKLASFKDDQTAINYLFKLQKLCLALSGVGLLGIPLAYLFIPYFYGLIFQQAVLPFIILLIGQLIFLISLPAHQAIFYYFSSPKVFVYSTIIQLSTLGVVGFFLIPAFGMMGAAWAVLGGTLTNFIIPSVWVVNRLRIWKSKS